MRWNPESRNQRLDADPIRHSSNECSSSETATSRWRAVELVINFLLGEKHFDFPISRIASESLSATFASHLKPDWPLFAKIAFKTLGFYCVTVLLSQMHLVALLCLSRSWTKPATNFVQNILVQNHLLATGTSRSPRRPKSLVGVHLEQKGDFKALGIMWYEVMVIKCFRPVSQFSFSVQFLSSFQVSLDRNDCLTIAGRLPKKVPKNYGESLEHFAMLTWRPSLCGSFSLFKKCNDYNNL